MSDLFELLESISKHVDRQVRMYALGGTALTILGLKTSTVDVDVNVDSGEEYAYLSDLFEGLGFKRLGPIRWLTQEGIAFDLFHGSFILGTDLLPDCLEISKFIRRFGQLELYTLSLYDIIISKLARGDDRDFDDIKQVFLKEVIDVKQLVERYRMTMETSIVGQYKQKLLDLIEIKFKEWSFKVDKRLVQGVRRWE